MTHSEKENGINEFLLSEIKNGHERAFDFIFRKYYKTLCAQANAYVNDFDKAQSLVQDCFIKLWVNRSELGKVKQLSPFLSIMVRNKCIDYLRKNKTKEKLLNTDVNYEADIYAEDTILIREFEERLVVALAILPERCREAFEYSRFQHFTYNEIAEKMFVSVKAVEALVSRALKILRKELRDYLPVTMFLFKIVHYL